MAGQVKLSCPAGGSVSINAADTASNLTATIPAATDTLVNLNSTQTLTNKTLSGATLTGTISGGTFSNSSITAANGNTVEATSGPTSTQLAGMRNKIINGAMMIDQRNAGAAISFASGPASTYTLDRWSFGYSQNSKITGQQNQGSVSPPSGYANYLGFTSQSAYSVGSYDYFLLNQPIEGLNISDLAWGTASAATVTLSFVVRSSLTGIFGGSLRNSGTARSYPFSYTISSANTWEQKTITISGDTSGTWLTTNGVGVYVAFTLGSGSGFLGTSGSWSSANYHGPTGATSVVGTNGATFYITGVQLEKGATATPFENRLYGTELALCQRYYETANFQIIYSGNVTSGTNYFSNIFFLVSKRAAPTVTPANANVSNFVTGAPLVNTVGTNGSEIYQQANGTGAGYYQYAWTASAEL